MGFLSTVFSRTSEWFEYWFVPPANIEVDLWEETDTVEFVGGPLDGYQHAVDHCRLYDLPTAVEFPVNAAIIQRLDDADAPLGMAPTSVAIYSLVQQDLRWRYQFDRRIAPPTANLFRTVVECHAKRNP